MARFFRKEGTGLFLPRFLKVTEEAQSPERQSRFSRWVARVMDDCIRIPGTNWRFGLDPIIGLLPGFGDSTAAVASLVLIHNALRFGVPTLILVRMMINILINTAFGALPFVGDVFSAWFKSNRRNYELLREYSGRDHKAKPRDYLIVVAFVLVLIALLSAIVTVAVWLLSSLVSVFSE